MTCIFVLCTCVSVCTGYVPAFISFLPKSLPKTPSALPVAPSFSPRRTPLLLRELLCQDLGGVGSDASLPLFSPSPRPLLNGTKTEEQVAGSGNQANGSENQMDTIKSRKVLVFPDLNGGCFDKQTCDNQNKACDLVLPSCDLVLPVSKTCDQTTSLCDSNGKELENAKVRRKVKKSLLETESTLYFLIWERGRVVISINIAVDTP